MVKPVGVFGTGELGYAEAGRFSLELDAGLGADGRIREDLVECEGASDAGGVLEGDSARVAGRGGHLDAVGVTVREASLLDGVAEVSLGSDVDIDFARGGVIRADDNGLEEVGGARAYAVVRASEEVFVRVLTVVGKFVDLAGFGSVHNPGEGLTFGAGLFAIQEDTAVIAGAAIGSIIEGRKVREVSGAGAEVGIGGSWSGPRRGGGVPHHLVEARGHEVAAGDDLPGGGVDHPLGDEATSGAVRAGGAKQRRRALNGADFMVGENGHRAVTVAVSAEAIGDAGHLIAIDGIANGEQRSCRPAR